MINFKIYANVAAAVLGILILLAVLATGTDWLFNGTIKVTFVLVYMLAGWFGWSFPTAISKLYQEIKEEKSCLK